MEKLNASFRILLCGSVLLLLPVMSAHAQGFLKQIWEIEVPPDSSYSDEYPLTHTFAQLFERPDGDIFAFGQGNYGYSEHDPHFVSSYQTFTPDGGENGLFHLSHGAYYWAQTSLYGEDSYINVLFWQDEYYALPYGYSIQRINTEDYGLNVQWALTAVSVNSYDEDVYFLGSDVIGDGVEPDTLVTAWREYGDEGSGFRILKHSTSGDPVSDSLYTGQSYINDVLFESSGAINLIRRYSEGNEDGYRILRVNPAGEFVDTLENPEASYTEFRACWLHNERALIAEVYNDDNSDNDYLSFWWHGRRDMGGGLLVEPRSDTSTNVMFYEADELLDGRIIVLAAEGDDDYPFIDDYYIYLLNHDATELLGWQALDDEVGAIDLLVHSDGTIIITGYNRNWQDYSDFIWGYKLSSDYVLGSDANYLTDVHSQRSQNNPNSASLTTFRLSPVQPNPFNNSTSFAVDLNTPGPLAITVHDILGRQVQVLHDGSLAPGIHRLVFNPTQLASGTYLLRAEFGGEVQVRRMLFLK